MPNSDLKKNCRKIICEQRKALSLNLQQKHAKQLCDNLVNHPIFIASQSIAAFWAHNNEINPALILKQALNLNKNCYLPILDTNHLLFSQINKETQYKNNKYGIPEPHLNPDNLIPPEKLDLVLLPLVAVDKLGNRLGMGGGFYDRTFNFKKNKNKNKPILIGLAYEFQYLENIPHDTHDIPLDGIATENAVILF